LCIAAGARTERNRQHLRALCYRGRKGGGDDFHLNDKGTGGLKILHLLPDHAGLFDRFAYGLKSARPCGLGRDQANMADDWHTLAIGYDKSRPRRSVKDFVKACETYFANAGSSQCIVER
jgi:hypothetical protein